jgi:hypothetical protein
MLLAVPAVVRRSTVALPSNDLDPAVGVSVEAGRGRS